MRGFLKSSGRWLRVGWFWPLVLLALPDCALQSGGLQLPGEFDPGTGDLSSAVMCDIPKVVQSDTPVPGDSDFACASSTDIGIGIADSVAATSLADGSRNSLLLDYSTEAQQQCGKGFPRRKDMSGPFPDGLPVCLNCMQQIPAKFATPQAVCIAKCKDLISAANPQPKEGVDAYCQANATVSTNFAPNICFGKVCSSGGTALNSFDDPRRPAEPVSWTNTALEPLIGTATTGSGNSLQRTAPTTGQAQADFNAGGASDQLITRGDAWVEFSAPNVTNLSQVLGVRPSCADITACADTDPHIFDIAFSIDLNSDGFAYAIESSGGVIKTVQVLEAYTPNETFRLHVVDNHDGTATISYWKVMGTCVPGMPCNEVKLQSQFAPTFPSYPLRIDASFREQNATLVNVSVMRIKDK